MWNLNLNSRAQCCKTTCFQFSFCVLVRKQRQRGENNFCFYNCTLILPSIVGQLMYVFAVVVLWKNMHMSLLGCFSYSTMDKKANFIWSVVWKWNFEGNLSCISKLPKTPYEPSFLFSELIIITLVIILIDWSKIILVRSYSFWTESKILDVGQNKKICCEM